MKTFGRALILSFLLSVTAHAGDPVLSYIELEAMAKAAVQTEVEALNGIVADYLGVPAAPVTDDRGYRRSDLKIFKTFGKSKGVAADVIYDVCLLTRETIGAITDQQITKANLKVTGNINAVNSLRASMSPRFFRIAERACLNGKQRFIERLAAATSQGQSLGYDAQTVKNIAHVVFFPADYAKPTLTKTFFKVLPILIQSTLFVKGLSAFTGWAVQGIWLSLIAVTGPALSLKNFAPKPDELFKQRDLSNIEIAECTRIDLTEQEKAFMPEELRSTTDPSRF